MSISIKFLGFLEHKINLNIFKISDFLVRVLPPYEKNGLKYFFVETWQFIHHLKALVELRRFLLLLKSFRVFLVEKYSKNSEKIWIFDYISWSSLDFNDGAVTIYYFEEEAKKAFLKRFTVSFEYWIQEVSL